MDLGPNTRVLVTGASGGLGRAIAGRLSRRGCQLVLTGRGGGQLDALASSLRATKVEADLSDGDQLAELIDAAGDVDVLIANAGLPAAGYLDTFSLDQIDRAIAVNLTAPILLARAFCGPMVERRRGHLVFVSSLSGRYITPGSSLYCSTKSGLSAFSAALRQDLHGTCVGVSTILPGPIHEAGMWAKGGQDAPAGLSTRSPAHVALATLRAIEEDRGEVTVAAAPARIGGALSQLAPDAVAALNRRLGARELVERIADAHAMSR